MTAHAVGVDELADLQLLRELRVGRVLSRVVTAPARRLVGQAERTEQVVVEAVLPDEELVHPLEVGAGLRTLDDAMVVGRREGHDLADAEVGDRARIGGLELGRQVDRPDTEDHGLPGHQTRHRVHRSDRPRVRDGERRTGEHARVEVVRADPSDHRLIGRDETGEVEGRDVLDDRDEEGTSTVGRRDVDRETEADRPALEDGRPPVDLGVATGHRRDRFEGADHRVRDEVRERDLAPVDALEVVVDDAAVDLEQLRRHLADRRRGRHGERTVHVLDDAGAGAAQPSRLGPVRVDRRDGGFEAAAGRRARRAVRACPVGAGRTGTEVGLPVGGDGVRIRVEALLPLRDQPGVDRGA